jgi:hypothetical protein
VTETDAAAKLNRRPRVDEAMVVTQPAPGQLPDMIDVDEGDRPSITEVNGTVARFEMAFDATAEKQRHAFGPPLSQRLGSYIYLGLSLTIWAVILYGRMGSGSSAIQDWVRARPDAAPIAFIILLSAVGNVLRSALRGVIVTRDAIEMRSVVFTMPRVRRFTWTQIDRLVLADDAVMLELWNGTYERLPRVQDGKGLSALLQYMAASRGKAVTRLEDRH